MALEKSADYFGTFLERVESQKSSDETSDGLVRILKALPADSGLPIGTLQKSTDLGFTEFSTELQTAEEAGYVSLSGSSAEEVVELTESGRLLASRLTNA